MDDRPRAAQRLDRLPVLRQVGDELLFVRELGRAHEIDAQHVAAVLEQVADDRAAGFAGSTGDDDAAQASATARVRAPSDAPVAGSK
jgi:hypothetical protein